MLLQATIHVERSTSREIDIGDGRTDSVDGPDREVTVEVEGDVEEGPCFLEVDGLRVVSPPGFELEPWEQEQAKDALCHQLILVEAAQQERREEALARAEDARQDERKLAAAAAREVAHA